MVHSVHHVWKNGFLTAENTVEKTPQGYQVNRRGVTTLIDKPIRFSGIQLFFQLPNAPAEVIIEPEGVFKKITATSSGTYYLAEPDGKGGDTYSYLNELLKKVILDVGFFNVNMFFKS